MRIRLNAGVLPALLSACLTASTSASSGAASQDGSLPESPRAEVTVVGATSVAPDGPRHARTDAQAHGRLSMLLLNLDCIEARPRTVRRAFADAVGLNLVDHFPKDRETVTTIDLQLRNIGAVEALETILGFSFMAGSPTWQVRDGILEVGPRDRLAVRTPPMTRVIEVTDMLLEPPHFVSPEHLWRGISGNQNPGLSSRPDPLSETVRRRPREVGAELVRSIVDGVEPEAWNPLTDEDRESGLSDPVDPRDPFKGRNLDPRATYPDTGTPAPILVQGRWASIKLQGRSLIVRGPAFVIRGIEGLPDPVPPPASLVPRRP
ncbi:MAG: hypothetical protein CMJ34_09125 [Phycisphaerae bacterium]|nr:hypothetical protein [Phycisphaerae bacterium]